MVDGDNIEMADKVISESIRSIIFHLRSGFQSIKNRFKLIRFNDNKRDRVWKPLWDEDVGEMTDILGDTDNWVGFI